MPKYSFHQVDVFTNQAFGGNPLAVFPDATGLERQQLQRIAREMNLSETTFVFPAEDKKANFKVKIFTPETELPFAGHPVIGTHWLLAHLGKVTLEEPVTRVTFELGVGHRSAQIFVQSGEVMRVLMDHQKPEFYATATRNQIERLATGLGLTPAAIVETGWPVQVVSTGVPQLFAPVRSLREIQALKPNRLDASVLNRICEELHPGTDCVMVLCLETECESSTVHTRMFAPQLGIPEDPATGSASGGLGAYLIENRVIETILPTTYITSEQGIEMGRPSKIDIEVDGAPGAITMVRVGGEVIPLIIGTIEW